MDSITNILIQKVIHILFHAIMTGLLSHILILFLEDKTVKALE